MTPTSAKSPKAYDRDDCMPPIGVSPTDPAAADMVALVYSRRTAIIRAQAKAKRLAASCRKMVVWGEDDVEFPDDCSIVVNKTQQVCFTQAANHLKDPIKATIEPVQKGEYSKWYWCGPEDEAMAAGIDPIYVGGVDPTTGQPYPPQPLPRPLVQQLQAMAQQEAIDPQWLCQLNDEYRAKTAQTILDEAWRLAKADKWAWRTVWANIVEGWQLPLYEYDQATGRHILGRNSIDATYIDQSVEDIDDAAEAGIDLYMDMDEALAKYPDQAEAIKRWAYQGNMTPAPMQGTVPEQYRDQFQRPLIRKIVWWLRNQPIKMTPEEAVNGGHVQRRGGFATADDAGTGGSPVSPDGAAAFPSQADNQGGEVAPTDGNADAGGGADGGVVGGPVGVDQPEEGFSLPHGQAVDPSHPAWPTRLGIRQISIIADAPAGPDWDRECPYGDIPLLHIKNIFVIGKPWGVGEPFAVRNLNKAYSRITTAAVDHTDYNAHSAKEMPASLANELEKEYGEAFVRPDQIIRVPDELWKKDEPSVRDIPVSSFSPDSMRIRELIAEDINEIGGRPDVTAGNTPTKNASGQLVAQLSDNAAAPLNFKAQQIVFMCEKLVDLMLFSEFRFRPLAELAEIAGIPVPLMALVREGLLSKAPNIAISISTGAGAAIERKRANYVQWNQMLSPDDGLPLADGRTTRELIGIDPDVSKRRSLAAKKEAAAAMGVQQKPPSEAISFKDLPVSGKVQMAAQASIQLAPEELQAQEDQQRADKAAEMEAKAKQNPSSGGAPNG